LQLALLGELAEMSRTMPLFIMLSLANLVVHLFAPRDGLEAWYMLADVEGVSVRHPGLQVLPHLANDVFIETTIISETLHVLAWSGEELLEPERCPAVRRWSSLG